MDAWLVITFVWFCMCAAIVVPLTVVFCVRSLKFFGTITTLFKNKLWVSSMITLLLCCMQLGADIALFTYPHDPNQNPFTYAIAFLIGTYSSFYITLTLRMYVAFKNFPAYALSNNAMFCVTFWILLITLVLYGMLIAMVEQELHDGFVSGQILVAMLFTLFAWILLSPLILYLMLKQLHKMIKDLADSANKIQNGTSGGYDAYDSLRDSGIGGNYDDNIRMHDDGNSQLVRNEAKQKDIVDLMCKITLLTVIEQVVFLLWLISACLYLFMSGYEIVVFFCLGTLDICCICFVVYFTFAFNHDQYLICCNMCHEKFKICCVKCCT